MEEHLGDTAAVYGLRFDVIHVRDHRCQPTLVLRPDTLFHFLGAETRVIPQGANHRNIHVREDIGRRPHDYQRADQQDQQRQYDKRLGPLQGDINDPTLLLELLASHRLCFNNSVPKNASARKCLAPPTELR